MPKIANAVLRRESGNRVWMVASTCGTISAAVPPWARRAIMSSTPVFERPHHREATAKLMTPVMNRLRRPKMSPRRPPVITMVA